MLRAPFLTQGYHGKPHASEALWAAAICTRRMLLSLTPDGYVQIVDRMKDVIKTGGEWVSSIEVEGLIRDLRVCGKRGCRRQDDKWGSARWRHRGARPDALLSGDEVRAHLLGCRGETDQPLCGAGTARIAFVAEIPKTSVGKIDKKAIRKLTE